MITIFYTYTEILYIILYRYYRIISSADTHARTHATPTRLPKHFCIPLKYVSGGRKTFYDNSLNPSDRIKYVFVRLYTKKIIFWRKNRLQYRKRTMKRMYYAKYIIITLPNSLVKCVIIINIRPEITIRRLVCCMHVKRSGAEENMWISVSIRIRPLKFHRVLSKCSSLFIRIVTVVTEIYFDEIVFRVRFIYKNMFLSSYYETCS